MNERKLDKAVTAAAKLAKLVTMKPGDVATLTLGDGTSVRVEAVRDRRNAMRLHFTAVAGNGQRLTVDAESG